jgi:hypothetical protein
MTFGLYSVTGTHPFGILAINLSTNMAKVIFEKNHKFSQIK